MTATLRNSFRAFLFLMALTCARAENGQLKGITSVRVVVEEVSAAGERVGLTKDQLQTDVELKLRQAGLTIAKVSAGCIPRIYLNVAVTGLGNAVFIGVELQECAILYRDVKIAVPGATTWKASAVAQNLDASEIRSSMKDNVDSFLNAWLSANPKTR